MRVPLGWVRDLVSWDLELPALCERLTLGGLEVAGVEQVGAEWDRTKIWVGEVLRVEQHPNADRLVLATVDYGHGVLQVVTGAPNLHVGDHGQKVVLALEGARLIDGHSDTLRYQTLKRGKIRGIESAGMVCSEKELGISNEHEGILILDADAPKGVPFADYYGDTVLDLDLTPNLARCFSMLGVAREVAALTGQRFVEPEYPLQTEGPAIAGQVEIEVADPDLCPRYSAALIRDVHIAPSPGWMQRRLKLAGMRPINNLVDITNYVMLELGQPLHAFDYRRLRPRAAGGVPAIIVRRAKPGERMNTLDGAQHTLSGQELLITDGAGPVGIAGVMGGLESEVTEQTVDVLLEAANFDNISIRHTSAALKLPSEAAQRFGRGVDPELTLVALRRAAELMRTLAGGTVARGFVDLYPGKAPLRHVTFPLAEVPRQLGISLARQEVEGMLTLLGFGCAPTGDGTALEVVVPSYRLDVSIPADLIEEVARLYGYDRLPTTLIAEEMPHLRPEPALEREERARDVLVACGLTEIITYSLNTLESEARLAPGAPLPDGTRYLRVANPLSRETEYLRQTLMASVLEAVARNLRFVERVAVFEIGHIYLRQEGQALPAEPTKICIALTGPREPRSWLAQESANMDYYDLKGIVEALCRHLGVQGASFEPGTHSALHPGRAAHLLVNGQVAGVLGELHPLVRQQFDLPEQAVCLAELDLAMLIAAAQPVARHTPISRMPTAKLDLAVVVDEAVPSDRVEATIRETGGALLVDVVLFDVYRGQQLGAGKKSLAYSLTFQSPDKTLTSEEAVQQRDRIVRALQRAFQAEIRS
ncbi:MAG: phenylalanine--tRNA ligase subunit beta [Anaerolineales bacterium]